MADKGILKVKIIFPHTAFFMLLFFLAGLHSSSLAAQSTEELSGDYRLHFEQTSKSCGAKIAPVDVDVALVFSGSNVRMKFPSSFLGISILDTKFNPQSGTFNEQLKQRVNLGPVEADLMLTIKGEIINLGDDAEIRYEVIFDKIADDPDWNCKVTGKGRARKL